MAKKLHKNRPLTNYCSNYNSSAKIKRVGSREFLFHWPFICEPSFGKRDVIKTIFSNPKPCSLMASHKICIYLLLLTSFYPEVSSKGHGEASISNSVIMGLPRPIEGQQIFLQENHTEIKVQAGATAALHCKLVGPLADGLVSWVRKRDYQLLTVGRQVYSSDQRVAVKMSLDGSDWILTLRWVSAGDQGRYECQVSSYPPQSLQVNLRVVEAKAEILGKRERHIHTGSSLRLVCLLKDATEDPTYVFWYRDSRMINYDSEWGVMVDNSKEASVLYVQSVSSTDEGNYTCEPSNASPASVYIHVVKPERPAGLHQETNTDKEPRSLAPISPTSSSPSSSTHLYVDSKIVLKVYFALILPLVLWKSDKGIHLLRPIYQILSTDGR